MLGTKKEMSYVETTPCPVQGACHVQIANAGLDEKRELDPVLHISQGLNGAVKADGND